MGSEPSTRTRGQVQRDGLLLLAGIVGFMWMIEAINTLDSNHLDNDGLYPHDVDRFWGILAAPFIHESFQHLISNTIPLVFMGAIIALRGWRLLAKVTLFVIVVGGVGVWLITPANTTVDGVSEHVVTIGASGVVFGYATYLFARGFVERSWLDLLAGLIVAVVWGAALVASLVPQAGVSWQAHLCGGIAGLLAAWVFSERRRARPPSPVTEAAP